MTAVYKCGPGRDPLETTAVLITCDCGSLEHAVNFSYYPADEWPELWFQYHLTTRRNIFERAWAAIRYVIGHRCRYGEWDQLTMAPNDARSLARFLLEYAEIATNQREKQRSQALAEMRQLTPL